MDCAVACPWFGPGGMIALWPIQQSNGVQLHKGAYGYIKRGIGIRNQLSMNNGMYRSRTK